MRILLSFIALILFFGFAVKSGAAENKFNNVEELFGQAATDSCYNFTFIDNSKVRGTLLEQEEMDASRDTWNNISYNTEKNLCIPEKKILAALHKSAALENQSQKRVQSYAHYSLLPYPSIEFFEEDQVDYYESFRSRDTIIYGGVLPFVAIPDSDLATEDHFFNEESFSLFLYFKRKF